MVMPIRHKSLQNTTFCIVNEEQAYNKSSSRTDLYRKRSTSFRICLPRTVCWSGCDLSALVFKICMLRPSDESFGKSAIALSTTCCQRTPHACAAAQLRFVGERKKKSQINKAERFITRAFLQSASKNNQNSPQ